MIRVRTLTKRYGAATVLDGVDLDLPRGGLTCLIGANGAGKSTLLTIIARLLAADAGTVSLDGMDVHSAPSAHVARALAILRQEVSLSVRLSVRELVSFGRYPHAKGRLRPQDVEAVDRALAWMDLADLEDRMVDELSGGQRQRVLVAMVLAQDTDYVLLDEPLNNLDMPHAAAMMSLLHRVATELGRTVVVVVHDVNAAAAYADRIVALRDGAVVADGTPAEVITAEGLERIFGAAFRVDVIGGAPVVNPYAPPAAVRSRATVATARPARYGRQLSHHLARKVDATWDEAADAGRVDFGSGQACLRAEGEHLVMELSAQPEAIGRWEHVLGDHLARFGARDGLVVGWERAGGGGTTYGPVGAPASR